METRIFSMKWDSEVFIESPGWKRAERLGAIQEVKADCRSEELTITITKALVDIDKTFIVYSTGKELGEWEVLDARLIDDKGRYYAFIECYRENSVLIFEPIADDTCAIELCIHTVAIPRNPSVKIAWFRGFSEECGIPDLPDDVKDKLTRWDINIDDTAGNGRIAHEDWLQSLQDDFRDIKDGIWKFTFPITTVSRKSLTSIHSIDKKMPLINSTLIIKSLTRGIREWCCYYEVVDDTGRNEDRLCYERGMQIVRESESKDEYLKKVDNIHADTKIFPEISPVISWNQKWLNPIDIRTGKKTRGGEQYLTFTPPSDEGHWSLIIPYISNIILPSPLEFTFEQGPGEFRFPFIVEFVEFRREITLVIKNIKKEIDHSKEYRRSDWISFSEPSRTDEYNESNQFLEDLYKGKRLQFTYEIDCEGNEIFELYESHCIDDRGGIHSPCVVPVRTDGKVMEFVDFPGSSKTVTLRLRSLSVVYNNPVIIPIE